MPSIRPNPSATIALRIANSLVLLACGGAIWLTGQAAAEDFLPFSYWNLLYLLPIGIFLMCGSFFAYGVKVPTTSHLSVAVTAAVIIVWLLSSAALRGCLNWFFVPEYVERLTGMVFLPALHASVTLGIYADWQLTKKSGFMSADEVWWNEKNLRMYFTFTAWILFFWGLGAWGSADEKSASVFRNDSEAIRETVFDLGFILFCIFLAKTCPRILLALTGIEPEPKSKRPRRKGFHLF